MFDLSRIYFIRGSSREAAHFVEQAGVYAESFGATAASGRSLMKTAEIHLHQGKVAEACKELCNAADLFKDVGRIYCLHTVC